jgi:F420H(2)-dependent quinone reductase
LWVANVEARPDVIVQDGDAKHTLTARRVIDDAEREGWWELAYSVYPQFAEYRKITDRDIPVYALEP